MLHSNQVAIEQIGHELEASVLVPGSKSISNRVLLLGALAEGTSKFSNIQTSDDSWVFVQALRELGFSIQQPDTTVCVINGSGGHIPARAASVWCGSAGTAARFLLAAAGAGSGTYRFDATEQMKRRPMTSLIHALESRGVHIDSETGTFPLELITEGMAGGHIQIDASESSQFVSAMLMAAPLCKSSLKIHADVQVSKPYVEMTTALMERFGVTVNQLAVDIFEVPNLYSYKALEYTVEPDASTASYFAAAAAIVGGRVTLEHLPLAGSLQGDIEFLRLLEIMGCRLAQHGSSTIVEGPGAGGLRGIEVDIGDISDMMMTLACVAPYANTPTTITNIAHVRGKESDRVNSVAVGLGRMGIRVEETEDTISVYPGTPAGTTIDSFGDHRIAMAFSIMGLKTPGVVIEDFHCVSKTCPTFFDMLRGMGSDRGQFASGMVT